MKGPSQLYKLARRLSQKTTVFPTEQPSKEAQPTKETPVSTPKEAQEAREMPPPDLPRPRELEVPLGSKLGEHESGASNYESAEEPEEGGSSAGKKRHWGSITPSALQKRRWV